MAENPGTKTKLTGRQKAAVLLISLGPELAAEVLRHCSDSQLERLTLDVASIKSVPRETEQQVLEECHQIALARDYSVPAGGDYARQMLAKAVGPARADETLSKVAPAVRPQPFAFMDKTDPGQVATLIEGEHPQTIALVLAYLNPSHAAAVLSRLDPEMQSEVATRLASAGGAPDAIVEQVAQLLREKLPSHKGGEARAFGGVSSLARLLTNADPSVEKTILDHLDGANPELAVEVRKLTFTFEDLLQVDGRAMQRILREVDQKDLALALRGASPELRDLIIKNLSTRAGQTLQEEMDLSGPVRLKLVEEAEQRVASVARRLADAEEIVIQRGGSDVFV